MATSAPARRLAHGAVALAFAGPAMLLGGVAWADDPTPAPADDTSTEAPVVQPSVGSWIIGGTELEGSAATPAKPVAKPAAKPVAKPAAATGTTTRSTRRQSTTRRSSAAGPAALPFTGNHVDALLPVGITMLVGGVLLTFVARPQRAVA